MTESRDNGLLYAAITAKLAQVAASLTDAASLAGGDGGDLEGGGEVEKIACKT
jgi:hypothetical protein